MELAPFAATGTLHIAGAVSELAGATRNLRGNAAGSLARIWAPDHGAAALPPVEEFGRQTVRMQLSLRRVSGFATYFSHEYSQLHSRSDDLALPGPLPGHRISPVDQHVSDSEMVAVRPLWLTDGKHDRENFI